MVSSIHVFEAKVMRTGASQDSRCKEGDDMIGRRRLTRGFVVSQRASTSSPCERILEPSYDSQRHIISQAILALVSGPMNLSRHLNGLDSSGAKCTAFDGVLGNSYVLEAGSGADDSG